MYGILFASYISLKLGYVDKDFFDDVFTLSKQIVTFDKYNISNIKLESLINHIKHDKKVFNQQIRWILPKGWGKILKEEVPQNLWVKLLDNYMKDGFYEKCINC